MSIAVMSEVWKSSSLKGSRLLLLLAIADHADDDGVAWPGIDSLARKTRMSRRQTITNIQALIEAGELELLDPGGLGAKDTNKYRVITKSAKTALFPNKGAVSANKGAIRANKGAVATAPEPSVKPSQSSERDHPEKRPPLTPAQLHALDPVADRALILRGKVRPFPPAGAGRDAYAAWDDLAREWDRRR